MLRELCLAALVSTSVLAAETNPDRWSTFWDDDEMIARIKPTINVQASLAEGLGWEGTGSAMQNANHVVIAISGSDAKVKSPIPYAKRPVVVKAASDLACIVEDGQNQFKDCSMSSNEEYLFTTNALGRVSFSVPVEDQLKKHSKGSLFPTLLIQTDYMDDDEWVVAHIDSDAHHALGMVTVMDLMDINSNLSTGAAEQVSKAIRFFTSLSKAYKVDRSLTKRHVDSPFSYDPTRNLVHSYLVHSTNGPVDLTRFIMSKSINRVHSPLDKRSTLESSWWSKAQNHPSIRKRSFNVAAKDDQNQWAVLHGRDVSVVVKDEDRGFMHSLVTTVDDSWNVLLSVLRRVGISISRLFGKIRSAFAFDDILRTNQFLGIFYRLLAPLGIRGMDLLKRNYKESLANMTDSTQSLFEGVISSLGGKDISLEKMRENAAHNADTVMRKGNVRLPSHLNVNGNDMAIPGIRDPLDADAKTHFLHDRIVNNLDAAALDLGNSTTWSRIQKLAGEAANSLASVASRDTLMAAHMHTLKFVSKTNLATISLAQILNFVRSLAVFSEQVSGKLLESFLNFLPLYWNLATALMLLPLRIPFLYGLWTNKLTKGTSDFTILDMLTLAGSVYGTWHYKMFNGHKAPFTDADIKVFKKVTQPELFLYTWNHDRTTYAMDSPQLRHHRLGIYDWIPRLHMTVTNTLQILAFDITMAIGGGSAGSPGALTIAPQVFSAIVGIMGRIAGYPFTQLESNDPELVKTSMMNPDRRFLGFWAWWLVEDVVRVARAPFKKMNEYPYLANLNLIIVGFPLNYYGLRVIRDTGKNVARSDWPRLAVLSTMWVEAGLLYVDLLLPYFESYLKRGKTEIALQPINRAMRIAKFWRDGVLLTMMYARNALVVSNHIVGMLSSSFQGEAGAGDGKRPDL